MVVSIHIICTDDVVSSAQRFPAASNWYWYPFCTMVSTRNMIRDTEKVSEEQNKTGGCVKYVGQNGGIMGMAVHERMYQRRKWESGARTECKR